MFFDFKKPMNVSTRIVITSLVSLVVGLGIAGLAHAAKFKDGESVDTKWQEKKLKAKVKKSESCFLVTYDSDGTQGYQPKSTVVPEGKMQAPRGSVAGTAGEKVSALWSDGQWYTAKIEKTTHCYLMDFIGWKTDGDVWVNEENVFPNDSIVKGDTSAKKLNEHKCPKRGFEKDGSWHNGGCGHYPVSSIQGCKAITNERECSNNLMTRGYGCSWNGLKCSVAGMD